MIGQEEEDRDMRIFRRGMEQGGLGLNVLRTANAARVRRWHPGFPDDEEQEVAWNGGDWGNAMAGEAGEACNVIKKLRRLETAKRGRPTETDQDDLKAKLGAELADVIIYADLVAQYYGLDLGDAVRAKFNATSAEYGFPEKL